MTKNIYSVGQVNQYIKNMFTQDFMMNRIYVKGEVSNCKYHSSGHIYFTLKDSSGTLSAVMFASYASKLPFRMKEGDSVVCLGSIEVYPRDGKYQLYAKEIMQEGEGILYQRFAELKKELEEMGMFASEYKKKIPGMVRKIGVVTAPTGAAIQDIRNITHRRNPYVQVILYPAQVQGQQASGSIVKGLQILDKMHLDVLIVGRGGGSIEDLWAFNEEEVARAIFSCETPIISAIGHETDFTIADYVADLRAPTPSAAAELAVYDIENFQNDLRKQKEILNHRMSEQLTKAIHRSELLNHKLQLVSPQSRLNEKRHLVSDLEERMKQRMTQKIEARRHKAALLAGHLEGDSPLRKISKGYAFLSDQQGKQIRSVDQTKIGDIVKIQIMDGQLEASIDSIHKARG